MVSDRNGSDRPRRVRHRACKLCGVTGTPAAPISSRGKCAPCGEALVDEAVRAMHSKQGEVWGRWAAGMLKAYCEATGGRVMVMHEGGVSSARSRSEAA